MAVMTRDVREETKKHDSEIIAVVRAMGGSVGKYRRERQKGIRAIVTVCTLRPELPRRRNFYLS